MTCNRPVQYIFSNKTGIRAPVVQKVSTNPAYSQAYSQIKSQVPVTFTLLVEARGALLSSQVASSVHPELYHIL
jgi:hypothetical protein